MKEYFCGHVGLNNELKSELNKSPQDSAEPRSTAGGQPQGRSRMRTLHIFFPAGPCLPVRSCGGAVLEGPLQGMLPEDRVIF